jgi:hypothetical protein
MTPREMVQRLHLCEQAVAYFGFQRLAALAEGDGSRESEARQEQAFMLGLARSWREKLRAGRTRPEGVTA